jgi:hypothetical protein
MKTLINKTRYIPTGYTEYKPDLGDYPKDMFAAYVQKFDRHVAAIFYTGKQSNSTWHYRFATMEEAGKKINDTISNLMSYADLKEKRKEARKAPTTLKVGDILDVSWGYDQTNVNFYQVVAVRGKRTVDIREIASRVVDNNGPTTHVVAVKDAFLTPRENQGDTDTYGRVMTKRVSDGHVRVYEFASAGLWDGRPMYETGMGYGH